MDESAGEKACKSPCMRAVLIGAQDWLGSYSVEEFSYGLEIRYALMASSDD